MTGMGPRGADLTVVLWVEVQVVQDHHVGRGQVDAEPAGLRGQQKHLKEG